MNLFNGLFNRFLNNSNVRINYSDNTPIKIQVMNKSLYGINVTFGSYIYKLFVPKRFYKGYNDAHERVLQNKELNALEKTYLNGYLNPKYHFANQPSKHIR